MTFQGKTIDPGKPVYVLCGNYSGKKTDYFFPLCAGEEKKYPSTRILRGVITEIRFHQDNPGQATYVRLWCSSIDWAEISLYENQKYYWGNSANAVKKTCII